MNHISQGSARTFNIKAVSSEAKAQFKNHKTLISLLTLRKNMSVAFYSNPSKGNEVVISMDAAVRHPFTPIPIVALWVSTMPQSPSLHFEVWSHDPIKVKEKKIKAFAGIFGKQNLAFLGGT